ncbi:amidohydrolase (plasmid) [Sinorhizobium meliloti]|uniref:amidohydrolase family protein n=1 Tax=Rhizobium meliloti TaxID=382 RepID=UPI000D1FC9F7|nr:amidohydrolase [Sinorhizobium meliloti]QPI27756.1 amidohydrolase [Sinorhizobium meliloti]RMI05503.1 amidohydrolase [Sinorhizobium meliloti]RVK56987.1 amidohydrolase [Sinorhizobium meliloti]WQO97477.1 amidohydrolase [Sinorhizobium meliloti]
MSEILIRNATIVAMDATHGTAPFTGDILIDGGKIKAMGAALAAKPDASIIEGHRKLVMPGLVNAHTHSSETFLRGRYERMPLEVWLLYAYPLLMNDPIGERLLYLRSLLLAMESLRNGVTTLCDDFFDPPRHDLDRLATVFRAYDDAGIRANVSSAVMNVHTLEALPFAREVMPTQLQDLLDFGPPMTAAAYLDYCKSAFSSLHGKSGRLNFMIAPSAPQRCSPDLMAACMDLAIENHVPFHTHILETKTQAVTGHLLHGKSLIAYMADLGLLKRNITIAHSVWVSDEDMCLMGEAGVSVAHNVVSNMKLGAGIAPIRRLLDAGVTIGLGTDGVSSNDTSRIFDVMRVAGLIHSASGPDYAKWVAADEILAMATIGGARTALLEQVTGSLEAGKAADLLILDLRTYPFMPLNDLAKHLVYSENGSSIETVIVAGRIVMHDRRLTALDEPAIFDEIAELVPAYLAEHADLERRNRIFEPVMAEIHHRAALMDIGLNRYHGTPPDVGRRT